MAMTPKLWSIDALATELDMNRRTVAKRLQNVRPAGTSKRQPGLASHHGP